MKKIILITSFILSLYQIGVGQKTFSISGQVVSAINYKPIFDYANVTVCIKDNPKSIVNIDSFGRFSMKNLKEGQYKIIVFDIAHKPFDTIISIPQNNINGLTIALECDCMGFDKNTAKKDIENRKPKLLLFGSIAPIIYKNQEKFEKKYKIKYEDFGCMPPQMECIEAYNQFIFEYLDKTFGKKWRKDVREDVCFFKQ
jgi:hypothetical protein